MMNTKKRKKNFYLKKYCSNNNEKLKETFPFVSYLRNFVSEKLKLHDFPFRHKRKKNLFQEFIFRIKVKN